ncbi:unnamed protein product [Moneuplotes crassus]|uniref:Uncharacterized protein n=1 Tax=Euplotes crassus TaxID=5936 RepID=A0AAD2D728_EUPCR|nr:unnamed protein product [Moneuplotes crassus]
MRFIFSTCQPSLGVGSIISISSFSLAFGKIMLKQSNLSLLYNSLAFLTLPLSAKKMFLLLCHS